METRTYLQELLVEGVARAVGDLQLREVLLFVGAGFVVSRIYMQV